MDTGIDTSHPELSGVLDTANGWDFVNNTGNVNSCDTLHAVRIAGIIGAVSNNQEGIAGIAGNATIIPVKIIENGIGYTSAALEALDFAIGKGAKIINCSWGSPHYNPALRSIMEENPEVLFICAAGNNGTEQYIYPAAFRLPNVVSVTSVNNQGNLAYQSNYGSRVITAAPGEDIYTLSNGQDYGYASGTSMAAAFATGAAALYQGLSPDKTAIDTAMALKLGVSPLTDLSDIVMSGGIINLEAMLAVTDEEIQAELDSRDFGEDEYDDEDSPLIPLANGVLERTDYYLGAPQTISTDSEEVNLCIQAKIISFRRNNSMGWRYYL